MVVCYTFRRLEQVCKSQHMIVLGQKCCCKCIAVGGAQHHPGYHDSGSLLILNGYQNGTCIVGFQGLEGEMSESGVICRTSTEKSELWKTKQQSLPFVTSQSFFLSLILTTVNWHNTTNDFFKTALSNFMGLRQRVCLFVSCILLSKMQ